MIVLLDDDGTAIRPATVGLRDRIYAWLRASRLDHDLAVGVRPEATVALALRAQRLVRPSMRLGMARSIECLLGDAIHPLPMRHVGVPLCRDRVLDSRVGLRAIVDRLAMSAPVSARGVAQIRVLLADGSGPLYFRKWKGDLRLELSSVLSSLDPGSS